MSIFKRITSTLSYEFGAAVSRVENQEAVMAQVIAESESRISELRARRQRVRTAALHLQQQKRKIEAQRECWQQRALRIAADDQQTALECLKRSNDAEQNAQGLEQQWLSTQKAETAISQSLQELEEQWQQLRQRFESMRHREHVATTKTALAGGLGHCSATGIEDCLERWESNISRIEMRTQTVIDSSPTDDLADQFASEESDLHLQQQLQALINKDG
ncbi:PspA/IM30 family protein [Gammaproteobacteria bacterium]|nr:PspA/IM30 family protein [Gammaproteobacteria bacterium]